MIAESYHKCNDCDAKTTLGQVVCDLCRASQIYLERMPSGWVEVPAHNDPDNLTTWHICKRCQVRVTQAVESKVYVVSPKTKGQFVKEPEQ